MEFIMKKVESSPLVSIEQIEHHIFLVRGRKIMLDEDLATLYQVPTKRLNEQGVRNIKRFPKDFAFQLKLKEWNSLKSQIATSNSRGGRRKPPRAFTEQGVAMLSSVLQSPQAIAVNIEIMRAFVKMRHFLGIQKEMTKELTELKSFLLKHSNESSREFRKVWQAIEKLGASSKNDQKIGFRLD